MKVKIFFIFLFFLSLHTPLLSLKLDRVILACDNNANYTQFWPLAAQLWREIVGVRPTLAFIAPHDVAIDETLGDVIRFEPIEGVPTSLYAQCIRLLLPCLFPNDVCIISDIDTLPLQKEFFIKHITDINDDCFVVYRDRYYGWFEKRTYMSYNAAKGSVWREIFHVYHYEDIPPIIRAWERHGLGWSTDELLLYKYLRSWGKKNKRRLKKLGFKPNKKKRISFKENLSHDIKRLSEADYIEINCPRPYESHKYKIDQIVQLALLAHKKREEKY